MSDKKFNNRNLREAIDNSRMTREQIADKVQCDTSSITKYYNGDRYPKTDVIIKLAKLFNVSTDYLLGVTDVATTDKDLKFVCDYTGLDETAIRNLHKIKEVLEKSKNKTSSIDFTIDKLHIGDIDNLDFYFYALSKIINSPSLTIDISRFYTALGYFFIADEQESVLDDLNESDLFFNSANEKLEVCYFRLNRDFSIITNKLSDLFYEQFYDDFKKKEIKAISETDEVMLNNPDKVNTIEIEYDF